MPKKKGICINYGGCEKARAKEVQEVEATQFVCGNEKCGKPLREYNDKPTTDWKKIAAIVGGVVVIGAGAYFLFSGDKEAALENLKLDKSSRELFVGAKDTLTVTNLPAEAKATYVWESDNPEVATVSNGIVTTVGEGEATISVVAKENEEAKASCDYKITKEELEEPEPPMILVEAIAIQETEKDLQLMEGDEAQLTPVFSPEGASDELTWTSSDDAVATVSESGLITAVKAGKATIKVTTQEGAKSASVVVTVKAEAKGPGRINLPYGYFEGPTNESGKPNGIGVAYVTKGYALDLKNRDKETLDLKPGDKIMNAKFKDGNLQQGELHRKDGTRKTITIGG